MDSINETTIDKVAFKLFIVCFIVHFTRRHKKKFVAKNRFNCFSIAVPVSFVPYDFLCLVLKLDLKSDRML